MEFLAKHDFYLANTWANESIVELMVMRVVWDQMCSAQVDFIAASSSLRLADSAVDGHTAFSTGYFAVRAEFVGRVARPERSERRPSTINLKFAHSWLIHAAAEDRKWSDWADCRVQ